MKNKKYYWKVVRKLKKGLTSVYAPGRFCLSYVLGETTEPNVGKLFVYSTRADARENKPRNTVILKVKATGVSLPKMSHVPSMLSQSQLIDDFWNEDPSQSLTDYLWFVQEGTLFADSVTPVEISH